MRWQRRAAEQFYRLSQPSSFNQAGRVPSIAASGKPAASAGAAVSGKPAASGVAPSSSGAAGSSAASGLPTVTMAYSEIVGVHATEWAAKEAGIFEKNGLNVNIQLIESSLGVGALLSNQTQIGSMGGSEMLAADVNGADLVAYATMSPVYPYVFMARASIKTPADLKGKKIGVSRIGSSSDIATRAWFKTVGLNPADVTFVQIGSLQARTAALKSGALDGAMASTTDVPALEASGLHELVDLAKEKIPAVNDCIIALRSWVADNHDVMQKFIDSVMQAYPLVKSNKQFTFNVFKKYLKVTDPQQLEADYDYYVGEVIPAKPVPDVQGFKDALEVLAAQNPKANGFDVTKVVDPSFVNNAISRGIGQSSS